MATTQQHISHDEIDAFISLLAALKHPLLKHAGRDGKKLHISTIYRWATRGVGGVRLKTWKVGGTRCTTEAALLEFIEQASERDSTPPTTSPTTSRRVRERRERAATEARQILGLD